MSEINYAAMSDEALRQYFLRHREDKTALRAYLDRLGDCPQDLITTVDDPNFDAKIAAAVSRKLQSAGTNSDAAV
jgi:hypothetical protein